MTFTAFAIGLTCVVLGALALALIYVVVAVVYYWVDAHLTLHRRENWDIVNPTTERGFPARFRGLSYWSRRVGSVGIYYVRATGPVKSRKPPLEPIDR